MRVVPPLRHANHDRVPTVVRAPLRLANHAGAPPPQLVTPHVPHGLFLQAGKVRACNEQRHVRK